MELKTIFAASVLSFTLFGCAGPAASDTNQRQYYSDAYKQVSEAMTSSRDAKKKGLRPASFSEYDDAYAPDEPGTNVLGTSALVYFLHLVYENPAFPIADNPVTFDCDWIVDGVSRQDNVISMVSSMDKQQGSIACDIYGDSHMSGASENYFYVNVDIDYDFASSSMNSFRLDMVGIRNGLIDRSGYVLICKYENGQFKTAFKSSQEGRDEYLALLEDTYWKPYSTKLQNAIHAEAEFSKEYGESMKLVYPD